MSPELQMKMISFGTNAIIVFLVFYSIILHEISHAMVSNWLGDDTAKRMGRLSLNPLKLIEAVEGGVHVVAFAFLLSHRVVILIINRQRVLALGGAYSISAGELSAVEFHSVEEMEFQLRNPGAVVGNTGGKHEIMRPEGHAAGILLHPDAGVGFAD